MECCIYIKQEINNLRQVIITQKNINNGYALKIYQHYSVMNNMYVANYVPVSAINLDNCHCYSEGIYGCLGLICIKGETFLILVTQIENLGVFDGKTIYRITDVAFISLISDAYDYSIDKRYQDLIQDEEVSNNIQVHPCNDLIKYLSRGTFYFSNDFDLTHCAQNRFLEIGTKKSLSYLESANSNFFWNKYLLKEFLNFRKHLLDIEKMELDRSGILLVVIQGFVAIRNIRTADEDSQICLISRLSCKRVGTRYNARGIDDDGNVANFVESEILFHNYEYYFSFLQIRGSVPLFWEQPQTAQMTHKIELSRGMESTAPAFKRHFEKMIKKYGHVYIINLLSKKEGTGENVLGREYDEHFRNSLKSIKNYINKLDFDFHEKYKNGEYIDCEEILNIINNDLDNFTYFLMRNGEIASKQLGVVRVNCLDCLDRTNVVETNIAWHIFRKFFLNEKNVNYISLVYGDDNFKTIFKNIWADNGDFLSRIYAGTGALKSSITRKGKQTVLGYLNDAKKSINRFVNNAFFDKSRQETINLLLGRFDNQTDVILHDPLSDAVQLKLQKQIHKFSSKGNITIYAGTWNVNGQPPNEDLYQWLYPEDDKIPDIYMIGIEEIVELTPQQVMSTDPEKRKIWEKEILRNLRKLDPGYIHLKSKQLVGAFISIYIRDKDVEKVRNVESMLYKTGLKGLAGNKGGVAISMNYYDSSFCFVVAHLAAGQQNIEDRNRDYATISEGIIFKGGRKITDHDFVIWIGDFNYRINNYPNEIVRQMVYDGKLEELLRNDQLITQMAEGRVFEGFQEGHITFRPTYKYDNNSDQFDTSEKARIPAWCDRVLFKGNKIQQKYYKSTNLYSSDHKPVKSLFDVEITIVDKETKRKIEKELYEQQLVIYKQRQATLMSSNKSNPFLDDDDTDNDFYPSLKKASTNYSHWWDLRQLTTQTSPDTYSISSNDSFRTDSSPVQSYSSPYYYGNTYNGSSLVNEITSDSDSIILSHDSYSYSSNGKAPINPFVAEPEESADEISVDSSPTKPIPKPLTSYTGPRQPPKPKTRTSQCGSIDVNPLHRRSPSKPLSRTGSASSSAPNTPNTPRQSPGVILSSTNVTSRDMVTSPVTVFPTIASNPFVAKSTAPSKPAIPTSAKPTSNPTSTTISSETPKSSTPSTPKPKPAPPKPSPKPTFSPKPGPKPAVSPKPVHEFNSMTTSSGSSTPKPAIAPKPSIGPKPAIAPKPKSDRIVKSTTTNSISSINKSNPNVTMSTSSSVSSLIHCFNTNTINNKTKEDEDDDSTVISHVSKAFTISSRESDDRTMVNSSSTKKGESEDLVVAESNVKPSAFKNGIFSAADALKKGEEKKMTRSATLPELNKEVAAVMEKPQPPKKPNITTVVGGNNSAESPTPGLIFNKKKQPPPIPQKPKTLNEVKPAGNDNVSPFDDQFSIN